MIDRSTPLPPALALDTDLHTHTTFSADARSTPETMAQMALDAGLTAIAFTEHAEWFGHQQPFETHVNAYLTAVHAARDRYLGRGLRVYSGAELGNPHWHPREAQALLDRYPLEVRVASLHWLDGHNIHDIGVFRNRAVEATVSAYFDELARMVDGFDFDIVGHFDRIFWRATLIGVTVELAAIEPAARRALAAVARRGVVLELNSKHVADRNNWNAALLVLLRWYREAGGERIAINSDAHHAREIARNAETAGRLLHAAGFTRLTPHAALPALHTA